jgi:hypothetical protein
MNSLNRLILTAAIVACVLLPVRAAETFAGTGTDVGNTLCYYVASAKYGVPRLSYINATSDKSASVIQFYSAASPLLVTATSAAGQTIVSAVPTTITNNDIVIVRSIANDTYQRCVVSSVTATNFVVGANLAFALAVGDPIYKVTAAGTIPVGAATKELNAGPGSIYNGQRNRPLLFEIDGTSACQINAASGFFDQ